LTCRKRLQLTSGFMMFSAEKFGQIPQAAQTMMLALMNSSGTVQIMRTRPCRQGCIYLSSEPINFVRFKSSCCLNNSVGIRRNSRNIIRLFTSIQFWLLCHQNHSVITPNSNLECPKRSEGCIERDECRNVQIHQY